MKACLKSFKLKKTKLNEERKLTINSIDYSDSIDYPDI